MNEDRRTGGEIVDDGDRGTGSHRFRARSVIVGIVVLLAGGLIVEQVGAAPASPRKATTKWSSFEPRLAPRPGASGSSNEPTGDAAIAAANQHADAAIARTQAAAGGRGTAAVTADPRVSARVCQSQLEEGARFIDRMNRLIAANPSLAPRLIEIRDRGVARMNAQLARYGCPISFG